MRECLYTRYQIYQDIVSHYDFCNNLVKEMSIILFLKSHCDIGIEKDGKGDLSNSQS